MILNILLFIQGNKEQIWLSHMTKATTPTENPNKQSDIKRHRIADRIADGQLEKQQPTDRCGCTDLRDPNFLT